MLQQLSHKTPSPTFSTFYFFKLLKQFLLCGLQKCILFGFCLLHFLHQVFHAWLIVHTINRKVNSFDYCFVKLREWLCFICVPSVKVYFWCYSTAIYKATQTVGMNEDYNGLDEFWKWPIVLSFKKVLKHDIKIFHDTMTVKTQSQSMFQGWMQCCSTQVNGITVNFWLKTTFLSWSSKS